ncbi:hypothetical protein CBM2625_U60014 [Cupriavidus taiwanensis]|nr:hypothetical protein CBM2614_U40026 [Cupriavidus taiwanensis]SPA12909.1 hypothetical protein CBM2625_U60014 [Cupriavidus taiwanensis]
MWFNWLLYQALAASAGPLAIDVAVQNDSAGTVSNFSLTSSPTRTMVRPPPGVGQWVSSGSW